MVSFPSPIAELRAVGARVGSTTILRDVDLRIEPGDVVGLFGANGAGKTTLLRILATLLVPDAGEGTVLGAAVDSSARIDVRRHIGLIGHVPGLYPELTLEENLVFSARLDGRRADEARSALDQVGLTRAAGRPAAACSHGMQRRAEFARELMRMPALLLLDEPHSALDAAAAELVTSLVAGVADAGGAAVVVSHDRERVEKLATRTVELAAGTLA